MAQRGTSQGSRTIEGGRGSASVWVVGRGWGGDGGETGGGVVVVGRRDISLG